MKTNRIPVYAILLLCLLACSAQFLMAQDPAEEAGGEEQEEQKAPSAAKRFALFLEAGGGAMSAENVEANIRNNGTFNSTSTISFTDFTYGQVTVGWQLPHDKGRFEVVYNGNREDTYSMVAQGQYAALCSEPTCIPESDTGSDPLPLVPWWNMEISNGTLHAEMHLPTWFADQNDTDGDLSVDLNEIIFSDMPAVVVDNPAQTDMQNSLQTYDLQYRRWFGGRRYSGTWSAGMRYLEYGGNVPAAFWISNDNNEFGWTSGGFQNPLIFTQETSGFGPTASLGFEIKYFRDRVQLFGETRLSFLFQSMETDSGNFFALLQDASGGLLSVPATISSEFDKDVWNVSGEAGVRVQLLSGLFFEVAYAINAHHDVVLLPTQMTIPDVLARLGQPVGGVFRSQDLVFDGVRSTLSFQF